jgi:hypothetical protein
MSGIYEYFQKIQGQIIEIKDSLLQLKQSWDSFQRAWDLFFTIVPWEVVLLLIFSVILLSIFNSISPNTPKVNLTLSVVLLSLLWAYFWGMFSKEVSITKIFVVSLYILLPLHAIGIGQLLYRWGKSSYWKKRRLAPKSWETALHQLTLDYHQLMSRAHGLHDSLPENRDAIETEIRRLEESLMGMKSLLGNKKTNGSESV